MPKEGEDEEIFDDWTTPEDDESAFSFEGKLEEEGDNSLDISETNLDLSD